MLIARYVRWKSEKSVLDSCPQSLHYSKTYSIIFLLVIQTAVNPIGDTGYYLPMLKLHVNLYTVPAFISIFLAIFNAVMVVVYYREHVVDIYAGTENDSDVTQYSK